MSERRRLFSALPKDVERIWILCQNAKELKDGIHALGKKVQKYRDNALLAWEESKQKNVHFEKWGVPCKIAPEVKKTTEQTSEESGDNEEETTVIRDDNVWEIPLNGDNSDVQAVMKVSPRKATVQYLKGDEGNLVKNVNSLAETENSLDQKPSSENPILENQSPLSSDNLLVVYHQNNSHSHDESVKPSHRQAKTFEVQNDDDTIRVHVEASGKTRNQVKILFGEENSADKTKNKTLSTVSAEGDSGEKKAEQVPRKDDTRERKAMKRKKKPSNQKKKPNISNSTSNTRVKKHSADGAPGSKYVPVKKNSETNVTKKNTQEKEQKMDYKPLPVKEDEKPDLNPGIAGYPTEKPSRDNRYKGLLNKHRVRKRSNLKDLKDVTSDTKTKESSYQCVKYSTVVDLNHKTKYDSEESNSRESGTKSNGRTVQVLSLSKRNGSVLESSIDIKIPKPSQRCQSRGIVKAGAQPSNPAEKSQKPFLKQILDLDITNESDCMGNWYVEHEDVMGRNQKMTQASKDDTDHQELLPKEEKIKVSYETFQALKTMIGQIDTSASKTKKNVTVVASRSAEVGSEHGSQQILGIPGCQDQVQTSELYPAEPIPGNTKQENSFLGAPLLNAVKQDDKSILQVNKREHNKGRIEDSRNVADSFLGAPLMSSTQQEEADNVKATEVEESNHIRRAIWSSTSDTNSVTSSRLGLDYSDRLRTTDEFRDENQLDMIDTDLKQTVPIRKTSSKFTNDLQQESRQKQNFLDASVIQENYFPRESYATNSGVTQSERKRDTGYNTLKTVTADVGPSYEINLYEQSLPGVGNVDQSYSEAERGELGRFSTLEQHSESLHTNSRSSFEISSSSERLKYGVEGENHDNTAEKKIERKTAIHGTERENPKRSLHSAIISRDAHLPQKVRSKHKSKYQDSKNAESRPFKCKREYRIQEIREFKSPDDDKEYQSRLQYKSTTEYSSDGNGTDSIHIDTSVICQSEPSANRRSSASDEREMGNDNVSNNNTAVQMSKRFNEHTKHRKTLESSESSRPECSESSDQSLLRCHSRTLSKKKKYRSRSKGRYWEKTEANLSELVKHYFGVHGGPL